MKRFSIRYVRYFNDSPTCPHTNLWVDTGTGSFTDEKLFVVQTGTKVIERCLLMATDPGDLVLDPLDHRVEGVQVAEKLARRHRDLVFELAEDFAEPGAELADRSRNPEHRQQVAVEERIVGVAVAVRIIDLAADDAEEMDLSLLRLAAVAEQLYRATTILSGHPYHRV